jgi:hypothetical protein
VKKVTISLPEELYRQARVRAAEQGTSISALVTQYLSGLAETDGRAARLRKAAELRARVRDEVCLGSNDNLSREELHERAALR